MTSKVPLLAVSVAAIALVLSGCDDMPVPPDARLVLTAADFTLAMG